MNRVREAEIYRWKEPEMSEFDELAFKEKPMDKDNHVMDAWRYGMVYIKSKNRLRTVFNPAEETAKRRQALWDERHNKLRYYKDNRKKMRNYEVDRMIKLHYNHKRHKNNMIRKVS